MNLKADNQTPAGPANHKLVATMDGLCRRLMKFRHDPSAIRIASEITEAYSELSQRGRLQFLIKLNDEYDVNSGAIIQAAKQYEQDPGFRNHQILTRVVEAPRQQLFRAINIAEDGLQTLIRMRQDLLQFDVPVRIGLAAVENDLKHLLQSWFNRGFLKLKRIDWESPARLLEKLIQYEAVHEIRHWDDLRRRLQTDRRCFAFFHPSLPDDPLVFVAVALTTKLSDNIASLISPDAEVTDPASADTAMFYSISSCQPGLTGISFGGLLIKQVLQELHVDLPSINRFSTLSPVPGFHQWLGQQQAVKDHRLFRLVTPAVDEALTAESIEPHQDELMSILAEYLLNARIDGRPVDSVARFHLGNGAQLQAIHWMADTSQNGFRKSFGIMVNYVYETAQIQMNRQNFLQHKIIAADPSIHALARKATIHRVPV